MESLYRCALWIQQRRSIILQLPEKHQTEHLWFINLHQALKKKGSEKCAALIVLELVKLSCSIFRRNKLKTLFIDFIIQLTFFSLQISGKESKSSASTGLNVGKENDTESRQNGNSFGQETPTWVVIRNLVPDGVALVALKNQAHRLSLWRGRQPKDERFWSF